jgi:hypothetical protein
VEVIIETEIIIIPFERRRMHVAESVCLSQPPPDEERLR